MCANCIVFYVYPVIMWLLGHIAWSQFFQKLTKWNLLSKYCLPLWTDLAKWHGYYKNTVLKMFILSPDDLSCVDIGFIIAYSHFPPWQIWNENLERKKCLPQSKWIFEAENSGAFSKYVSCHVKEVVLPNPRIQSIHRKR